MSDQPHVDVELGAVDFNIVYEGGELLPGLITGGVPWDIEDVQPGVVEFERRKRFRGEILDAGCGLADNAAYLAALGHKVAAFDGSSTAIKLAKERHAGTPIELFVADATKLTGYDGRFDTVLDSALFQVLDPRGQQLYLEALHRSTTPGAWLNILAFAAVPGGMPAPMAIPEETLRASIAAGGWEITSMEMGTFSGVEASMAVFLERFGVTPNADGKGQIHVPTWLIEAQRV
jgi:SAM-dependent methyltransferase